jgi:hypothetical protein
MEKILEQLCEFNPDKISSLLDYLDSDDSFRGLARDLGKEENYFHMMKHTSKEKFEFIFEGFFTGSDFEKFIKFREYILEMKEYLCQWCYSLPNSTAVGVWLKKSGFRDIPQRKDGYYNYIPYAKSFMETIFNTLEPEKTRLSQIREWELMCAYIEAKGGIPKVHPMDALEVRIGQCV